MYLIFISVFLSSRNLSPFSCWLFPKPCVRPHKQICEAHMRLPGRRLPPHDVQYWFLYRCASSEIKELTLCANVTNILGAEAWILLFVYLYCHSVWWWSREILGRTTLPLSFSFLREFPVLKFISSCLQCWIRTLLSSVESEHFVPEACLDGAVTGWPLRADTDADIFRADICIL